MVDVLQPGLDIDLSNLPFMTTCSTTVFGIAGCRVSRCGYTGEDGVEVGILTHSLIHHFETVPNSKKLQTTTEMWLLKDFKIQIP